MQGIACKTIRSNICVVGILQRCNNSSTLAHLRAARSAKDLLHVQHAQIIEVALLGIVHLREKTTRKWLGLASGSVDQLPFCKLYICPERFVHVEQIEQTSYKLLGS